MEQCFLDLMYLISCALHNKNAVLREDMDIQRILMEGYGQSCELLALSAVLSAENNEIIDALPQMRTYLMKKTAKETLRNANLYKMIADLEDNGFNPVIIKGATLAELYPNSALRESVDTDLLFLSKDRCDAATRFLIGRGGEAQNVKNTEKHNIVLFPGVGRIEIHHSLYNESFSKYRLKKENVVKQPFERITLKSGGKILSLGKTDALKFIFCHMLGHFIYNRCDLKQICDILLYVREYKDEIDRTELNDFLNKTGYMKAFSTVIGAGVKYLGFKSDELFDEKYSPETVELFMTDCLNGCTIGVWKNGGGSRRGGGAASSKRMNVSPKSYLEKVVKIGILPEKTVLQGLYPYSRRNPALLPAAWLNNIFDLSRGTLINRKKLRGRENVLKNIGVID